MLNLSYAKITETRQKGHMSGIYQIIIITEDGFKNKNKLYIKLVHKHIIIAKSAIPTSESRVWFPAWPQLGKLVVACRWLAVYSTEP